VVAGGNLAAFVARGYQVTGFDAMPESESVTYCRQSGLADVHLHDLGRSWPLESATARAVVLLDVLQHISDLPIGAHACGVGPPAGGKASRH
jgi:hypothetical protein